MSTPEIARTWKQNWRRLKDFEGGGQGDVKLVEPHANAGKVAFLKILKHQNDPARRKRMFREVSAYKTLKHPGIPVLLESNADAFEDLEYKLYAVTEFIEGCTLSTFVTDKGPIPLETAVNLAIELLAITAHSHENDVVHRDIKPDNILLRACDPLRPVLVDFGLSFNSSEAADPHRTPTAEELGNRFLRLPELSVSSAAKQDPRSDITFCAGILLFALTGEHPAILLDESGRMPHQRTHIRTKLEAAKAASPALLASFDRAFQMDVRRRWQSAAEYRDTLESLRDQGPSSTVTADDIWKRIDSYSAQPHVKAVGDLSQSLQAPLEAVREVTYKVRARVAGSFHDSQTGASHNTAEGFHSIMYAFVPNGRPDSKPDWITFKAEAVGSELLVTASRQGETRTLLRTNLEHPTLGPEFSKDVERVFLEQIQDSIDRQTG